MHDIFISHAAEDEAVAKSLADALRRSGLSVWWDDELAAGDTLRDVIEKQLADARCVLVLWSAHSVVSDFVREEAARARKRLFPIVIDDSQPPVGSGESPPVSWSRSTSDESFKKLLNSVRRFLDRNIRWVDWMFLGMMAAGLVLTVSVIPSSLLNNPRLNLILQGIAWVLGSGLVVQVWRSRARLAKFSQSMAFRVPAVLLVTVPWLFILPLVTIRPKLTPPNSLFVVSIDGETEDLPQFRVPLQNTVIALTAADDKKSEFRLTAAAGLWTFLQLGPRWRLLEPEWRRIYELPVDCFRGVCPTPLTVTFTLNGRYDNRVPSSMTHEGAPIRFDGPGRMTVALHAGDYAVTVAVKGKPCSDPLTPLAIPSPQPYYQLRTSDCSITPGK